MGIGAGAACGVSALPGSEFSEARSAAVVHIAARCAEKRIAKQRKLHKCYGVYMHFAEGATTPLYIGSASYSFEKRVEMHLFNDARYIDVICFDGQHWPFQFALEAFLITRMKPRENRVFKVYNIKCLPADKHNSLPSSDAG